ncbi:MAG: VPLPA-CTERM sorting domain-containing protein [Paracoccaceae bacterium]
MLTFAGTGHAALFNPTNNIVAGGNYDIDKGPYIFGVLFTEADGPTAYTFDFFNSSAVTKTIGLVEATLLQTRTSKFLGGMVAAWSNGQSFSGGEGPALFEIKTVLAPGAMDRLTLAFGDPQGQGAPGVQMNVEAVAAVPLPAGGLLLLGALGGIAALRRRKSV